MKKTLKSSDLCMVVNTNGGYIDIFEDNGKSVFFPKVMVKIGDKLKVRGGMHVCAPNFGADAIYDKLDQHGFLRNMEWEIDDLKEDTISLSVDGIDLYSNFKFKLIYKLELRSLFIRLSIFNNSSISRPIAPGFHPYFHTNQKEVTIDDIKIDYDKLPSSIYKKEKDQKFITNDNNIEIIGNENINEYVFRTDFMGDYICIEPTYSSNAFSDHEKELFMLEPGRKFSQEIEIRLN